MNITQEYREGSQAIKKYGKTQPWLAIVNKHIDSFMQEAAESLEISTREFAQKIDNAGHSQFLSDIFFETFVEQEFNDENIITEYLKRRGWKHSKITVTCLEHIRDRFFSIYEVIKVNQGESITVKDYLFKTKNIEVIERLASNCTGPGCFIIGKVIEVEGKYFFAGCIAPITIDYAEWLRDELKKDFKEENISITQYKKYKLIPLDLCLEFKPLLEMYVFSMFITALACRIFSPRVVDNEGNEIKITHINFKIKDKTQVLDVIEKNKKYFNKNSNSDLWILYEDVKETNDSLPAGSRRILAKITIKNDKLTCIANSEARTISCIELIQKLMMESIGMPVLEHKDIFSRDHENKTLKKSKQSDIPEDIKKEVIEKHIHEHLKSSLDIKIPILKNKTPRQCAKTNKKLVINWLIMMEKNINQQIPGGGYDISWVYKELGL